MRPVIIVIDKIEDDIDYNNKPYKKVTDKEGNEWKVKQGRGGKLKDKWDILKEDLAYELSIDKYEGKDFVADFELVKDELKVEAAKEVAGKAPGFAAQEIGMWYKEVGEMIRAGMIKYDKPEDKALMLAYKTRMLDVLGIKVTKKEETN